eukprot:TRINITY_DN19542_c0_g3_i2.p1 TRINITY_DN19542_c0_g3~~TRINITY_DN19542_c0_g3_i2.p1  ORF type:complete len:166 (+),score=31.57 TRINITY_DN19542_c0_g3_i2:117-614(+)
MLSPYTCAEVECKALPKRSQCDAETNFASMTTSQVSDSRLTFSIDSLQDVRQSVTNGSLPDFSDAPTSDNFLALSKGEENGDDLALVAARAQDKRNESAEAPPIDMTDIIETKKAQWQQRRMRRAERLKEKRLMRPAFSSRDHVSSDFCSSDCICNELTNGGEQP